MATWVDAVGNVRGRALSSHPAAPAMLVGSHYDTVIDGGKFDGALGIVAGIAAVKALVLEAAVQANALTLGQLEEAVAPFSSTCAATNDSVATSGAPGVAAGGFLDVEKLLLKHLKEAARPSLPRPVEVVAFSDEEGVRFQSTFLGSKGLAGSLVESGVLGVRDAQGVTLLEALRAKGLADTEEDIQAAALGRGALAGYVEVHLEQGPVLEAGGAAVGVVTGIAGQTRLLASLRGQQGHAGTVPMRLRRDPLAGAAEAMVELERICNLASQGHGGVDGDTAGKYALGFDPGSDPSLVCTVGSIQLWPGASNVIPATANFTLDVRSQSDEHRGAVLAAMRRRMDDICARRKLECGLELRHQAAAVLSDAAVTAALTEAVRESGALLAPTPPPDGAHFCPVSSSSGLNFTAVARLMSGAGHDAMAMAAVAPVGMLFVRCAGGVSHAPEELVAPDDVAAGTAALLQFLRGWERKTW